MANFEQMNGKEMAIAHAEMVNTLTDALGIIENESVQNSVKADALYVKVDCHLLKISNRANDDDVEMLKQLYEALEERERNYAE